MRGERSRTYLNADGTYTTQVFTRRTAFRRRDGAMVTVDPTLVPRTAGASGPQSSSANGWVERSSENSLGFAEYADDPSLVSLEVDATHSVGYQISGAAHVAGQVSGNQVTYPEVFPGADVRLLAGDEQVKEQLVLKSADAPATWTFPLQLTGLHPRLLAGGDVVFVDDAGVEQAYVPGGFMTDSKIDARSGEGQRSDGVTYSLTTVNGAPALQVSLDRSWLNDPARVFPVTVDPSVQKIADDRDTYVMSGFDRDNSADTAAL